MVPSGVEEDLADHLCEDNIYTRYEAKHMPSNIFVHDVFHLAGYTYQIMAGGILHDVTRHSHWYPPSEYTIIVAGRKFEKRDIMEAFCFSHSDNHWGCPHEWHTMATLYEPGEDGCPGDFCPAYPDCPFHEEFVENVIEPLDEDVADWEEY